MIVFFCVTCTCNQIFIHHTDMSTSDIYIFNFIHHHVDTLFNLITTAFIRQNLGPRPFPTHNYYLSDLWIFNITTNFWKGNYKNIYYLIDEHLYTVSILQIF